MAEADLLQRVKKVLAEASQPLLAKEIAAALKRQGLEVDRSVINQVLYRNADATFIKREDHRWVASSKPASKASSNAHSATPQSSEPKVRKPNAPATKVVTKQPTHQLAPQPPSTSSKPDFKPRKVTVGKLGEGARKLSTQHVSIRVPWHDSGWDGRVCRDPQANTACLVLVNIGEKRKDEVEAKCAGQRIDQLDEKDWPPCVEERATFLAPFELNRTIRHPYATFSPGTHGHLKATKFRMPAYSAPAIPFNWLRRERVEGTEDDPGLAERLQLGYEPALEPVLDFDRGKGEGEDGEDRQAGWINTRPNQLCLLDTFFGALEPSKSLCFFYAKRTPLAPEDTRRVIIGVGYVTGVGDSIEYDRDTSDSTKLRAVTFERNVLHSIRPGFEQGFVFPYQAVLEACEKDPSLDPASYLAFAPDDDREHFSYVAEHVSHDSAIGALLACAGAVQRVKGVVPGSWDPVLSWIDRQLNRLWEMRGPCPGMGSALTALGVPNGTLVAQDLAAAQTVFNVDPWGSFEKALDDPTLLSEGVGDYIGADIKRLYKKLPAERRNLLHLLSRFAIDEEQATRFYQDTERSDAGIQATDRELLKNPYLLYELDRTAENPIGLLQVDRGLFPETLIRDKHPLPSPSALEGPLDGRRVRAFVIDALEQAADDGHTLQLRDQVIHYVRKREVRPEMPLSKDVLTASEQPLEPFVHSITLPDGTPAFQLARFVSTGELIRREVSKRRKGKRHASAQQWRKVIDRQFKEDTGPVDADENRAREEKAAALEELYASRISVLLGAAGTGKTTLLKSLCDLPEVNEGGVLLLAPTGKARVKLESQTKRKGAKTVAQFLLGFGRYDGRTGRYFVASSNTKRNKDHKTVVIDECSMLTEEQLAAVLDALTNVERLILVGDPRQLPPIGTGRPFVDIVSHLAPPDLETRFPRVAPNYAELTVSRRQKGTEVRDDLLLAQWFSGRPVAPGGDEIWQRLNTHASKSLRLLKWSTAAELDALLLQVIAEELKFPTPNDECAFEESLGATRFEGKTYFRAAKDSPSVTEKAESWQILSPVRAGLHGVDAVNRLIQETFRKRAKQMANEEVFYKRKIPPPMGPQNLMYGDKVISVINRVRKYCYPKPAENPYVANGDIGIAIGDYRSSKGKGFVPKNLAVEFVAHAGIGVKYFKSEFKDDGTPPLELAYALTVHKTQGSEFGITFVVLPNPCRLLSRELLYTALTRQKDKIVLLHQGEVRDLLRFSDASESEIARRCTNLFEEPRLVVVENRFLEDRLLHRTSRGERVRSKSEVIVADKLHQLGIEYQYELPHYGTDGSYRLPDFTVDDPASGLKVFWEHLGMLSVPEYKRSWDRKLAWYASNGVLPGEGGLNGILVTSEDSPSGGIDSKALDEQIRRVFSL